MAIANTEMLFFLIKSLTKAEKRSFRLFAHRNADGADLLYMTLFDVIDKAKTFDEAKIRKEFPKLKTANFTNLKRHLYEQLMICLRLLKKDKQKNIKIREYIDFAYVLYGKGLQLQALEILNKARKLASSTYSDFSLITIIELEKMIQSRHITRSESEPIQQLVSESTEVGERINIRIRLSNLRLHLHKMYIEKGHIYDQKEGDELKQFFNIQLFGIEESDLGVFEKVYYYQSFVWYYYIIDDFNSCLKYAIKWVELFKSSDELQLRDINLFMRGYHYVLTSAFNIRNSSILEKYLDELEKLRKEMYSKFNLNSQIISFLYVHTGRMNFHFMKGSFEEGIKGVSRTLTRISKYKSKLDIHKIMVLYYKIAWMNLGSMNYSTAIKYLNAILNMSDKALREDIQIYARLMNIMAHYDIEKFNKIQFELLPETNTFFKSCTRINQVDTLIFEMFERVSVAPLMDRKEIFKKYYAKLMDKKDKPYEKRSFVYLDILFWIESKVKNVSLSEVIKAQNY